MKGVLEYDYNCYNGKNRLAKYCMLRMKEEKKEKVKEEAYFLMNLEELHTKSKNLSLTAKGADEGDGTY